MTVVLLIAAALRLAQVGDAPPGLHYDEAADIILAREIAEGRHAPIFIPAYTGKEVLFFYWAAGWMKLIGPTPFAMRWAAATMGLLTVAATYWAVREMFHSPPLSSPPKSGGERGGAGLALLAAAFVATSFWHVLMSRLGFRSIAEPCVQAFAVAAVWRGARLDSRRWSIAGGAFVGLNLYTYLAARLFPIVVALPFLYLIVFDADRRRERLIQFALVVLAAAIVFAPLGAYFLQNPDAFLTRIAQVGPREGQDVPANALRALGMFFVEGDPYVRFNLPGRPLFPTVLGLLFVVGLLVGLLGVFRGRTALRRAAYGFALSSTLIMLLPTALAVNDITPSNLRAIGMMPAVFVLPALGAWVILKRMKFARRFRLHPSSLILLLVVALAAEAGHVYFADYARLPSLYYESDGDLVDISTRLNDLDIEQTPAYVHALHYRHPTLAALARDFHAVKSMTGPDVIAFPPGPSIHIFAHLALPDWEWLNRFGLDAASVEVAAGPDGQPSFAVIRMDAPPSLQPQATMRANFGGTIALLGYTIEATPRSGGAVDATLFWRVLGPADRDDDALFVELRDAWNGRWGQANSFDYPSEQWTPGETIVQRVRVPVAAGAPRGDYVLHVGWYSAGANRRLSILAANGSFGGTTAALGPIPIARSLREADRSALGVGQWIDAPVIDGLRLLGSAIETPIAPQGGPMFFTLFWRADSMLPDQPVSIRIKSAPGDVSYNLVTQSPAHDTYPFDEWPPGEVVADRYGLRVPGAAPAGEYTLEARVRPGDWIAFGRVRVEPIERRFDPPPIAHEVNVTFGDQIELLGYDLDRETLRPGESITLTLVWRALTVSEADYSVFTHLLDPSGVQRGGKDNAPVNGAYNTSLWIEGEVVVDTYVIPLDADAPPGAYTLEVGLYRFESGARLPLSAGGDALGLAAIEVSP